ncbi:fimbrial protein [Morganella morganii]|uniref:fimbrial protein n=1 Tax=Morganella morganii TaxID=582 RepID=UPI001BDB2F54|nr:fimbrial protein [Morganella morganii]MBT0521000.1 type 1 fimbrial protein [Morganella morganii subsp. morganii]QWL90037.1 type 1 fimbrial protein [Morganella morganii subsp. morganii]
MNRPAAFSLLFSAALTFSAAFIPAGHAADNLRVIGELFNDPCTLLPENKDLVVDFSDVSLPDLYNGIEVQKSFALILSDCDITDMNRFKIKFTGTGTPDMPSYLALDPSSDAGGFSVGIRTDNISLIPLNQFSNTITIAGNGENTIRFTAFLQVDPKAKAGKTIKYGAFNATAFLTIDYF